MNLEFFLGKRDWLEYLNNRIFLKNYSYFIQITFLN